MDNLRIPLIELELLNSLVAISEAGNFTAAAKIVHRTPSAISMQVKKLEEVIGRQVFERNARSVTLTPVGEVLLRHARKALNDNREVLAEVTTPEMIGEIRIGVIDDIAEHYLPQILGTFHQRWPGVVIHIQVNNTHDLCEMIQQDQLDLAIISADATYPKAFPVVELKTERIVWAGLANGCAGSKRPLPLTVWNDSCTFNRLASKALDAAKIPYIKTVISHTTKGQQISVLADFTIAPLGESSLNGKIINVGKQYNLPEIGSYKIGYIKANKTLTKPVETLIDFLHATID